jgi:hypothetical protein
MSVQPGDMFLSHSPGILGKIITFGEKIRTPSADAFWDHGGIIIDTQGNTLEAAAKGIVSMNISDHPISVTIDSGMTPSQREDVLAFAESCKGDPYSYVDILSISIRLVTGLHLSFHGSRAMICSEFAAKCWEHGGKIWPMLDMACVMPSNLGEWLIPPHITKQAKLAETLTKITPEDDHTFIRHLNYKGEEDEA